jgi:hypothetical protein
MKKQILSETLLFSGEVKMPKHYDIDRYQIKSEILNSKLNKKTVSANPYHYAFSDYEVPTSKTLNLLRDYISENIKFEHKLILEPRLSFGNVFEPKQQSFFRNMIDPVNVKEAPDYIMIYGIDVDKDASVVIETKDKRGIEQLSVFNIINNNFLLFPSYLRFFINENNSHQTNVFLTTTYVKL